MNKRIKARDTMIDFLVNNDIDDIRQAIMQDDIEFLDNVLRGEGWKPYNQLNDKEIEEEYNERKQQ